MISSPASSKEASNTNPGVLICEPFAEYQAKSKDYLTSHQLGDLRHRVYQLGHANLQSKCPQTRV
jgi:hypothetical protein